MRLTWLSVGVLVAALAATAPFGLAHGTQGESFGHLNVDVQSLGPGENRTLHLDPGMEGPLKAGWVLALYGGVQGEVPVVVNLSYDGIPIAEWVWSPGEFHQNTTRLGFTGEHVLTLWNPSRTQTTQYAFYFDMSCNCVGKVIPLPGGFVLFNYDLPAGRETTVAFPSLDGWRLKGAVATLPKEEASWPEDFEILLEGHVEGAGWMNLSFTPPREDRYYVYVEAQEGASLEKPVDLTPLVRVEPAKSSFPGTLVAILALVGLTLLRRRPG